MSLTDFFSPLRSLDLRGSIRNKLQMTSTNRLNSLLTLAFRCSAGLHHQRRRRSLVISLVFSIGGAGDDVIDSVTSSHV